MWNIRENITKYRAGHSEIAKDRRLIDRDTPYGQDKGRMSSRKSKSARRICRPHFGVAPFSLSLRLLFFLSLLNYHFSLISVSSFLHTCQRSVWSSSYSFFPLFSFFPFFLIFFFFYTIPCLLRHSSPKSHVILHTALGAGSPRVEESGEPSPKRLGTGRKWEVKNESIQQEGKEEKQTG